MDEKGIIERLETLANPTNAEGMKHFGIQGKNILGISVPILRKLSKEICTNHLLALKLWDAGIHESRILATMVDDPLETTERQLDMWAKELDSWDICDHFCGNLVDKTPYAYEKAIQWSYQGLEFTKRAGFSLMAVLAVHDKKAKDEKFYPFLDRIRDEAEDSRNFVKKAVNWALRQIGKRNQCLRIKAIQTAEKILKSPSKTSHWIASDALRELKNETKIELMNSKLL